MAYKYKYINNTIQILINKINRRFNPITTLNIIYNIFLCSKYMFNKLIIALQNNSSINSLKINIKQFNNARLIQLINAIKNNLSNIIIFIYQINNCSVYNLKYGLCKYINCLSDINIKIIMKIYDINILQHNVNIKQFLKNNYVKIFFCKNNNESLIKLLDKNNIYTLAILNPILNKQLNKTLSNTSNIYKLHLKFDDYTITKYKYKFIKNCNIKKLKINIYSQEQLDSLSKYLKYNNTLIELYLKLAYTQLNLLNFFESIHDNTSIKIFKIYSLYRLAYGVNDGKYICNYLKHNNILEKIVIASNYNINYYFKAILNNTSLKKIKLIVDSSINTNLNKYIYVFLSNNNTITSLNIDIYNMNNINYLSKGIKHNTSLQSLTIYSCFCYHEDINKLFKVLTENRNIIKLKLYKFLLPNYDILTNYISNNSIISYLLLNNINFTSYNDNQFDLFAESLSKNTTIYKLKITLFNSHQIVKLFDSLKYNKYISDLIIYIVYNKYTDYNLDIDYNNIIYLLNKCTKDTLKYNNILVNIQYYIDI